MSSARDVKFEISGDQLATTSIDITYDNGFPNYYKESERVGGKDWTVKNIPNQDHIKTLKAYCQRECVFTHPTSTITLKYENSKFIDKQFQLCLFKCSMGKGMSSIMQYENYSVRNGDLYLTV